MEKLLFLLHSQFSVKWGVVSTENQKNDILLLYYVFVPVLSLKMIRFFILSI